MQLLNSPSASRFFNYGMFHLISSEFTWCRSTYLRSNWKHLLFLVLNILIYFLLNNFLLCLRLPGNPAKRNKSVGVDLNLVSNKKKEKLICLISILMLVLLLHRCWFIANNHNLLLWHHSFGGLHIYFSIFNLIAACLFLRS